MIMEKNVIKRIVDFIVVVATAVSAYLGASAHTIF